MADGLDQDFPPEEIKLILSAYADALDQIALGKEGVRPGFEARLVIVTSLLAEVRIGERDPGRLRAAARAEIPWPRPSDVPGWPADQKPATASPSSTAFSSADG